MDVPPQRRTLASDHERRLRVRLESDQAVDNVGAGLLELTRPDDVRLFVETGLDLHQHHDLLASVGGGDQVADDGRIAARAIQSHLDRENVRIRGSLRNELLRRRGKALVRVMDQDVAISNSGEDVDRLAFIRGHKAGRHDRRVGGQLQVRPVEAGDLPQPGVIKHVGDLVAVRRVHADALLEDVPHRGRHGLVEFDSDRFAEPAPPQLLFEGEHEVVGLVLLKLQVRIPGYAEQVRLQDGHAGEEHVQVRGDDLLEENELARLDPEEARQDRRHLDPREPLLLVLRVLHADGQ